MKYFIRLKILYNHVTNKGPSNYFEPVIRTHTQPTVLEKFVVWKFIYCQARYKESHITQTQLY